MASRGGGGFGQFVVCLGVVFLLLFLLLPRLFEESQSKDDAPSLRAENAKLRAKIESLEEDPSEPSGTSVVAKENAKLRARIEALEAAPAGGAGQDENAAEEEESTDGQSSKGQSQRKTTSECEANLVLPPPGHTDLEKFVGRMRGEVGNDWSACTHLKQYGLNFASYLARFLTYQLRPKSVLEFGGGLGTTSDYLARFAGADVTTLEPDRALAQLVAAVHPSTRWQGADKGMMHMLSVNVLNEDSRECAASLEAKQFDLVISFEVLEHIPLKAHDDITRFLAASVGKWLVFSAARPKQVGTGHFDESMLDHATWVKAFQKAGLTYMPQLTKMAIKSGWYPRAYDFGTNLMVFKNPSNEAEDTDKPHEMLKYYWIGNQGFVPQPQVKEGSDIWKFSHEYREGVESSLWPELSHLSKKVQKGTVSC